MSALACALLALGPQQFVERPGVLPGPVVWSEAVITLDADRDGRWDLFVVNSQGFAVPGDFRAPSAEPIRPDLLLCTGVSEGLPAFRDASAECLPEGLRLHGKGVAAADCDGDGFDDLAIAVAYGARQRLLRRDPAALRYLDESLRLPDLTLNAFAVGCGDLDDDGDLDLVFSDSGARSFGGRGGRTRLLVNDGRGFFADESERLPEAYKVGQQNVKVVDIDGDLDLDLVVDGKSAETLLYLNDGSGRFALDAEVIPRAEWAGSDFARDRERAASGDPALRAEHDDGMGSYEIEWGDLDGDLDIDAVYMNLAMGQGMPFRDGTLENRLAQDGRLAFVAATDTLAGRVVDDENDFALVDVDDDGDLDLIVGQLPYFDGPDKLFENAGAFGPGFLAELEGGLTPISDATLDLAVADFDGDGDYDLVTVQGEAAGGDFTNRYYENQGPPDTHAPVIGRVTALPPHVDVRALRGGLPVRAWIQDAVVDDGCCYVGAELRWSVEREGATVAGSQPMPHVGGGVHRAGLVAAAAADGLVGARVRVAVEAVDGSGNRSRSDEQAFVVSGAEPFGSGVGLELSATALPDGEWLLRIAGDRPGVEGSLHVGRRSAAGAELRGAEYVAGEGRRLERFRCDAAGRAELRTALPPAGGEWVLQAFVPGPAGLPRSSAGVRIVLP